MPRDGSMTPRDLIGHLDELRIECLKCDRHGRYPDDQLAVRIGLDGQLTDWLSILTKDCRRKNMSGLSDPCAARIPDLLKLGLRSDGSDNAA